MISLGTKWVGKLLILSAMLAAGALYQNDARAWSEHHLITAAALARTDVANRFVEVTPFEDLLWSFGMADAREFNELIQIRKDYVFQFVAGEVPGKRISLLTVLSTYSDEPDWKMDTELFGSDQYPELWKPEYAKMGGKVGTPSQAFRHMYWPSSFRHFIAAFKLPHPFGTMGVAPERAAIFLYLSRKARALGQDYWAARFEADALHYLEDVSQPFHATQTPTKKFLLMPFRGKYGVGTKHFIAQVTNLVAYYHFAFEQYVGKLLADPPAGSPGEEFVRSLALAKKGPKDLRFKGGDISRLVRAMAKHSVGLSPKSARSAIVFFPAPKEEYDLLDSEKALDDAWWREVMKRGESASKAKRTYFAIVDRSFEMLGYAVRQVVLREEDFASVKP